MRYIRELYPFIGLFLFSSLVISCVSHLPKRSYKDGLSCNGCDSINSNETGDCETPYLNGQRNGIQRCYFPSGQTLMSTFYTDDKAFMEITYHESGSPLIETPMINSKEHGVQKYYYETGELKAEIPWNHGKRQGMQKEYSRNGDLAGTAIYENGILVGMKNCTDGRKGNFSLDCTK